jgi:hypothetical protein
MPIRIEEGAKVVRDTRLTVIRVLSTLHDRYVGETKDRVREALIAKDARYAESDLVVAQLRAGNDRGPVCPSKLYKLVQKGDLTMKQFLSVLTVRKEPLRAILPGGLVEQLSAPVTDPRPSLVTEFKEGVEFEPRDIEQLVSTMVSSAIVTR